MQIYDNDNALGDPLNAANGVFTTTITNLGDGHPLDRLGFARAGGFLIPSNTAFGLATITATTPGGASARR